jgi:hypothetical protein
MTESRSSIHKKEEVFFDAESFRHQKTFLYFQIAKVALREFQMSDSKFQSAIA